MVDYKQALSDDQYAVVKSEANILLRACPGSGKTRTIVYKIAYMLENGMNDQRDIIAITYTNRAAEEIINRISRMGIETKFLWVGTIHKFCIEQIICKYRCYLDQLNCGYRIVDDYEQKKILKEINDEKFYGVNLFDLNYVLDTFGNPVGCNTQEKKLLDDYHAYLYHNKLIDFNLILYYAYLLLEKYPVIGERLKGLFSSIYVDEYQDTQELQYQILSKIVNSKAHAELNLLFVGDVDQAIYTGIGGVVKNKEEIEDIFSGYNFEERSLTGCYRSTQQIVDYYSNYLNEFYEINAIGDNAFEASIIDIDRTIPADDIAEKIAGIIEKELADGVKPNDICIAAPAWRLIFPLSKELKERLPELQFDAPDIAPMKRDQLNILYRISKVLLMDVIKDNYSSFIFEANSIKELLVDECGVDIKLSNTNLLSLILRNKSQSSIGTIFLLESLTAVFEELGIDISNHKILKDKLVMYFENIDMRINKFKIKNEVDFYKTFFKPKKGVVLSSCHGVKGEEYHTFITYGLLEGIIPHFKEVQKDEVEAIRSAKRLLYVSASRAKRNLYLIAEHRLKWRKVIDKTSILIDIKS